VLSAHPQSLSLVLGESQSHRHAPNGITADTNLDCRCVDPYKRSSIVSGHLTNVSSMTTTHVVTRTVHHLHRVMGEVTDAPVYALDAAATREALVELSRHQAQVAELEARLLTHAHTVQAHEADQSKDVKQWWANATGHRHTTGAGRVKLAEGLAAYPDLAAAMAAGDVVAEQARVIINAVNALSPQHRAEGLVEMLTQAKTFDAQALVVLGRKVLEVIDPDAYEAHEQKLLEAEEARAAAKTSLHLWQSEEGFYQGRFTIPALQGAKLKKALMSLAAPAQIRAREGAGAYDYTIPTPQRLGEALCAFIDDKVETDLVVTIDLDTLRDQANRAGWAETGDHFSATALRQAACEAGLIPAVLGSHGRVLDLGHKTRLFTKAQRLALLIERHTCEITGCDTPAHLCHAHHQTPWAHGGTTNVTNARLVCPKHHRDLHQHPNRTPHWRPMRT